MSSGPHPDRDEGVGLRARAREVIFRADTRAGQAFDVVLLVLILASVLLVMFESVPEVREDHRRLLVGLELAVTLVFSVEYVARIWAAEDRRGYVTSFFGIIDLLAIVPGYVSLVFPGAQALLITRALRLLRIFRVFKMARWLGEANFLVSAMRSSARKILVFLLTVLLINLIMGAAMYLVEGAEHGFDSIFRGVYWSIVTMSTVGFGDITPRTPFGQVMASGLMILGYSILAVPTGIVSSEMATQRRATTDHVTCPRCGVGEHHPEARHCWRCGEAFARDDQPGGTDSP